MDRLYLEDAVNVAQHIRFLRTLSIITVLTTSCGDQTSFVENGSYTTRAGAVEGETADATAADAAEINAASAGGGDTLAAYPETLEDLLAYMEAQGVVSGDTTTGEGAEGSEITTVEMPGSTSPGETEGGIAPGGEPPITLPTTPTELKALCDSFEQQSLSKLFTYNDPKQTCDWDTNGNHGKLNGTIRARREQIASLDLPTGALLCEMTFASEEQAMRYDDEVFLLFNGIVLLSSYDYSDRLPTKDGFMFYDWPSLLDTPYAQSQAGDLFCIGEADGLGDCFMPPTETNGSMQLWIDPDLVHALSVYSGLAYGDKTDAKASNVKAEFTFVTTGDNDRSDCQHKDFSFTVNAKYVVLE